MVIDLVLLGLGIALQPFRLSAFILILCTKDGTRKGLGFILGWLASLVLVIAVTVLITHGRAVRFHTLPGNVVQIAKLALGIALLVMAAVQSRKRGPPRILTMLMTRLDTMSPWTAAVLAAIVQPWTLVAAGAANITAAQLSSAATYLTLVLFCLLATSSFLAMEGYTIISPAAAEIRLRGLRTWLDTHRDQIIIALCALLGCWLVATSVYYLLT